MKQTNRRITAAMILAAMLACITACGDGSADNNLPTDTSGGTTTESAVNENLPVMPEKDYGGREFNIACHEQNNLYEELYTESITGDVVDDAIYGRNAAVEEALGVELNFTKVAANASVFTQQIEANVLSDDACWDMCVGNGMYFVQKITSNIYVNYHDIPHLEYDKPWWNKTAVDYGTFLGKMYLFYPNISSISVGDATTLVTNRELMDSFKVEMPYELVRTGKWTFDKLIAMTKDVYRDLNGNTTVDNNDLFGFTCYDQRECWGSAFDFDVIIEKDGEVVLNPDHDKLSAVIEKMYSFYYETTGSLVTNDYKIDDIVQTEWHVKKFMNNQAMTGIFSIKNIAANLRYSDIDYGILPIPKWDENQENYGTMMATHATTVFPRTNRDLDFTGYVLNYMCYETCEKIVPAYYQVAMKEKILQNEDDKEMLDIIFDSALLLNSYQYTAFTNMAGVVDYMMDERNNNFASWFDSRKSTAEELLEEFNAYLTE